MQNILYVFIVIIPILIIILITYVIIRVLMHKNKGIINYGNSSLNILENNTTKDEKEEDNKENN
ncbi:MAG TPA: hypothetical protein VIK84_04295 [Haloplasmataceae bacterium]